MELTMYDFEQYIHKDQNEARAEQMWDNKSQDFYERTEKKQKQFANGFVFRLIKTGNCSKRILAFWISAAEQEGIYLNLRHLLRTLPVSIFLQRCLRMRKKNCSISRKQS